MRTLTLAFIASLAFTAAFAQPTAQPVPASGSRVTLKLQPPADQIPVPPILKEETTVLPPPPEALAEELPASR